MFFAFFRKKARLQNRNPRKIPFFTVVTPSFNSGRFIEETLRSVDLQRQSGRVRVEHIIMDGGSTDRTEEIVRKYAHPDTHFIREKDNGPADAINKGLARAQGEYLCWLNSDDVYAPYALDRAAAVLERYPDAAFCFGHCPVIDYKGREIRRFVTLWKMLFFPLSCHFLIRSLNYISQPAMFFRRSAWLTAGPLRTNLKAAWDYDLTLRLWHHGGAVAMGRPECAYFRWTPGSISGSHFRQQFAEDFQCAKADAGKWALSTQIHAFTSWAVIFLYEHLCSRNPEPVTKHRVDIHTEEQLEAYRKEADLATAALNEASDSDS